jgi:hypothetical protein
MNHPANPSELNNAGLDQLLRDFYRREMPSPWPAFRVPTQGTIPSARLPLPRRRPLLAVSTLSLAAALGLLLLCSWLLPNSSPSPELPSIPFGPGQASRPQLPPMPSLPPFENLDPSPQNPEK